jgi:hypothetical protein
MHTTPIALIAVAKVRFHHSGCGQVDIGGLFCGFNGLGHPVAVPVPCVVHDDRLSSGLLPEKLRSIST